MAAYQVCFEGNVTLRVGRTVYSKCPVSSVTVCDNDSATYAHVPVDEDGKFKVDFELSASASEHVRIGLQSSAGDQDMFSPRLTDRLKFFWHGLTTKDESHYLPYEYLIAAGHVAVSDITAATKKTHKFTHNFNDIELHADILASPAMAESYNKLVQENRIQSSVLNQSAEMCKLMEEQGEFIQKNIEDTCVMGNNIKPYSNPVSFGQMGGEVVLLVDMQDTQRARKTLSLPLSAVVYAIVTGYNLNAVHPADCKHLSSANLFHIFNDQACFFTICDIAAGYDIDVTLGENPMITFTPKDRFAVTKVDTECFSHACSLPNSTGVRLSANDCEDHASTIEAVIEAICRACSYEDERIDDLIGNKLYVNLSPECIQGVKDTFNRYNGMFKARREYKPFAVNTPTSQKDDQINNNISLGLAMGMSAGDQQAMMGGHCYTVSTIKGPNIALSGILEGTARSKELSASDCCKHMPIAIETSESNVPALLQRGFSVMQASADTVIMQKDVTFDEFIMAMESTPYMAVKQKTCRRTIPCVTAAHRHGTKLMRRSNGQFGNEISDKINHSFYQQVLYMGSGIVTEIGDDGKEHLGTMLPCYDPTDPDIHVTPVTRSKLSAEKLEALNKYKRERVYEMHEPINRDLEQDIIDKWQPIECAAPIRGKNVNEFMDNHYCITVSESSLTKEGKAENMQRAKMLTSQFNAMQAAQNGPHSMICYPAIHAAVRTIIFDKRAVQEAHAGEARVEAGAREGAKVRTKAAQKAHTKKA